MTQQEQRNFNIQNVLMRTAPSTMDWIIESLVRCPEEIILVFKNEVDTAHYRNLYRDLFLNSVNSDKSDQFRHPIFKSIDSSFVGLGGKIIIHPNVLRDMDSPGLHAAHEEMILVNQIERNKEKLDAEKFEWIQK